MTRQEFLRLSKRLFQACYIILERKNNDYSKPSDPLSNFRYRGVEQIMSRTYEKFSRLDQLLLGGKEAEVDESVLDTLMDMVNYLIILAIVIHEQDGLPPSIADVEVVQAKSEVEGADRPPLDERQKDLPFDADDKSFSDKGVA